MMDDHGVLFTQFDGYKVEFQTAHLFGWAMARLSVALEVAAAAGQPGVIVTVGVVVVSLPPVLVTRTKSKGDGIYLH